ncbi:CS1-pili formation C-terminal domain-containing protein [Photobacterium damselae]|uniref:CS1-pili formation C-terminal domain-containing protein n=1 Tax=Photobacterium damselae TaxID=38293 RepID=UPI0040688447
MNKKKFIYSILIIILIISSDACAKFIPVGFEHFYDYTNNEVVVYLPNKKQKVISIVSNIEKIKKINDIEKLTDGLQSSGVEKERIPEILSAIISQNNKKIRTVYNYDGKTLKLDIPSDYMTSKSKTSDFTDAEPDDSALITQTRLYASSYNGNTDVSINNYSTVGFDKSHLNIDTRLSSDDSFSVESASYNVDFKGTSLAFGYSDDGNNLLNSTSVFDYSAGTDEFNISYYSNDNLLIKNGSSTGRVYFDMKANGSYQVKKNGKVIYNESALKGQNFISYKNLPVGIYQIEIELRPNGLKKEYLTRQVVNVSSITSQRGFDYSLSYKSSEQYINNKNYTSDYMTTSGTYSLYDDRLLLGTNFSFDSTDYHLGLGARFLIKSFNVTTYIENLSDDGYLIALNSSYNGFNFDYKSVYLNDFNSLSNLSIVRYGDHTYRQSNISYSFPFLDSYISIYASRYEAEIGDDNEETETNTLSLNYQDNIFKNITLDLNYGFNSTDGYNEHTIGASVSIPLNDNFNYTSGVEYSSLSGSRLDNTLDFNSEFDINHINFSNNASVTESIDNKSSSIIIAASSNLDNDYFSGNSFVSLSNDGYSNITMNANTSSIITNKSVYFTKDRADSYVILDNDNTDLNIHDDLGLVDLHKNNSYRQRQTIKSGYTVVPIDEYSEYDISIDNEVSGYKSINKLGTNAIFSYPGTIKKIDNKVQEVVTFLTYFEDFNKEPLNDIECKGAGCLSVDKVGNGIYNISLIKENDFKLTSNNQVCLVDNDVVNHTKDSSKCFPSISEQPNGLQLVTSGFNKNENEVVYYLGIKDEVIPSELSARIENLDMHIVEYNFNKKVHLFVKVNKMLDSNLTASTFDLISQVQKYASIEKNIGNYSRIN